MQRDALYVADLVDSSRTIRGYLDGVTREQRIHELIQAYQATAQASHDAALALDDIALRASAPSYILALAKPGVPKSSQAAPMTASAWRPECRCRATATA